MESKNYNKNALMLLVVGVMTLVVLVFGATYAYFSITSGNTSGTTTITGDIGGEKLGSVTLTGGNANLYLSVTSLDMSEPNKGTTYYSSTTEGSRETNVNNAGKSTFTATLSGDDTDEILYACDYEFTVTSTGTALGQESLKDVELIFEGDINKNINVTGEDKISGTWYGFKNSNAERSFNAYLKLTNTTSEQNDIAGKNLSVQIKNTNWKCYISELDELKGEAYAVYTESDKTLTFLRSETPISTSGTHNGKAITNVFTDFENKTWTMTGIGSDVPWMDIKPLITNVVFEDEIRPIDTKGWFQYLGDNAIVDITKLNTVYVEDMSYMFATTKIQTIDGLENLNTSNVKYMSGMFSYITTNEDIDLSDWDTSNVTDMSGMFSWSTINNIINVSGWNLSNVTNMSNMFEAATIKKDMGISSWDVSNVENMYYMFFDVRPYVDINLSSWDVSSVTNHENILFIGDENATGTLTLPLAWQTAE